jgi:hypothetical protein
MVSLAFSRPAELEPRLEARVHDPQALLGWHREGSAWRLRVLDPHADRVAAACVRKPLAQMGGTARFGLRRHPVIAYRRIARDGASVVVVLSFAPVPRPGYRVGVPAPGFYRELVNSDSRLYGGSDTGNAGGVYAAPRGEAGHPHSVVLTLPPLAGLVLGAA